MKITKFKQSPKPDTMNLQTEPLMIWFDRLTLLEIERGDTLREVRQAIREQWGLNKADAEQLAACWFALGERQHAKQLGAPWRKAELSVEPTRKYLAKLPAARTSKRAKRRLP